MLWAQIIPELLISYTQCIKGGGFINLMTIFCSDYIVKLVQFFFACDEMVKSLDSVHNTTLVQDIYIIGLGTFTELWKISIPLNKSKLFYIFVNLYWIYWPNTFIELHMILFWLLWWFSIEGRLGEWWNCWRGCCKRSYRRSRSSRRSNGEKCEFINFWASAILVRASVISWWI